MVDVAGFAAEEGSVNYVVFVQGKQVAVTHSKLFVVLFALICDRLANLFADVLDHYVLRGKSEPFKIKELTVGMRKGHYDEFYLSKLQRVSDSA